MTALAFTTSLGSVLAASPARAAGPWFVAPGGANGASCLSAATPCATLTGVLAKPGFQAGDTVNVAAGTYADRPLVTKGVKVVGGGAGATFVGSASTTAGWALAVNAGAATVELQNVTLTNGNYQAGGALPIVSGNVRTTNVSITNSKSAAGGGVYLWAGSATLVMTGGEVSGNRATAPSANLGWGGAIYVGAGTSLTLDGANVHDNVADGAGKSYGLGGAILNVGSTTVRGSTLRHNEATAPAGASFGGAIYHNGTSLVLVDDDFVANTAAIGGGLATSQPVTTTNLDFDANTALAAGAVYPAASYAQTGGSMTGNTATTNYGGAIYAPATASAPTSVSLTDVDLTGNTAPSAGGALYATANVTTTIRDSVVSGNSSQSGGGIFNSGSITVRDSEISGNAASFQGGGLTNGSTVVADAPSATVVDTVVRGNSAAVAGGGLQNLSRATLAVTGGRVDDNSAAGGGGIVVGDASTASVTRTTVSGNTATSLGGAGVFSSGNLSVDRSVLTANKALGNNGIGGAVYSGSATANASTTLQVEASTLSGNQAYGGSAVVVYSTGSGATNTATIARSTVAGNASTSQYGAIEQVGRPVTITHSTITDNTAAAGGAGGLATGAPAGGGVSNTVFSGNTPKACSGPVVNNGGNHAGPGDTGCGVATSADPQLGPLGDNGGPTPTRLPSATSPLLDKLACGPGADQRGTARPQGAKCDIGAVEREQVAPTVAGPAHVDLAVGSPAAPAATVTTTGSPQPTLAATGVPAGLTFADKGDGTGTLSGTPAAGTGGVHTVTVTATNEAGSAQKEIE
ncbi:MAG TPA: choice-of-anchor Q domain-containing protein, partial [Nocardioides sp.]|nr:choice-of-anchor Q domain-containing protein [Nocardioides sp.]